MEPPKYDVIGMKLSIEFNKLAEYFDTPGRESPHAIRTNRSIEQILRKYKVKTVLDLTCGTGMQAFYLAKRGYEVTGADISSELVRIASSKARKEKMRMKFLHGDARYQGWQFRCCHNNIQCSRLSHKKGL